MARQDTPACPSFSLLHEPRTTVEHPQQSHGLTTRGVGRWTALEDGSQHPWCIQTELTADLLAWVGGPHEDVSLEGATDAQTSLETPNPDVTTVSVSGDAPTLVVADTCTEPPVPAL